MTEDKEQSVSTIVGKDGVEREVVFVPEKKKPPNGVNWNVASCCFSILGIFTLGFVFVPIGAFLAVVGSYYAFRANWNGGESFNLIIAVIAWILVIAGFIHSPLLWVVFALFLPSS